MRVVMVADPKVRLIHQPHHAGGYFVLCEPPARKVMLDLPAHGREYAGKCQQPVVLALLLPRAKRRAVDHLLASGAVTACRLDFGAGRNSDLHVCPSRWNGQLFDTRDHLGISDFRLTVVVGERRSNFSARNKTAAHSTSIALRQVPARLNELAIFFILSNCKDACVCSLTKEVVSPVISSRPVLT